MTLTPSEKRALRLALNLAKQSEMALIDANEPEMGCAASADQIETIAQCQRNIQAFERVLIKIEKAR
jgi:hypothetical protein